MRVVIVVLLCLFVVVAIHADQQDVQLLPDLGKNLFVLEDVDPLPNSDTVRSELGEIVLTFKNVTKGTGDNNLVLLHKVVELKQNKTLNNMSWVRLEKLDATVVVQTGIFDNNTNFAVEPDTKELVLRIALPSGTEMDYETDYRIVLSPNLLHDMPPRLHNWHFKTEAKPKDPGASTEVQVDTIQVFGIGIFVLDIGGVDLKAGTFKADILVFLLEYYLRFEDQETAIREAMNENRTCKDVQHGEKFQFLRNKTVTQLSNLNFINTLANPSPEFVFDSAKHGVFDHYRVRSSWTFSPQIQEYPFQDQDLPIHLEISGQSVMRKPTALLCVLETFSGFAQNLSSFTNTYYQHSKPSFTSTFTVREDTNWPPLSGTFEPPYRFPHDHKVARQPTRMSSRLTWNVKLHRPRLNGVLEVAPALFVASGALVSYVLKVNEPNRLTVCTTSMLAAVVQHSGIRSRIAERSAVTNADILMLVVYTLIVCAMFSTVFLSVIFNHRTLHIYTENLNSIVKVVGLSSPLLFIVFIDGGQRNPASWFGAFIAIAITSTFFYNFSMIRKQCTKSGIPYDPLWQTEGDVNLVDHWTPTQVAYWVERLALPHTTRTDMNRYAHLLLAEKIDGKTFHELTSANLKSIGIPLGHSIKIIHAIQDLLRGQSVETKAEFVPFEIDS